MKLPSLVNCFTECQLQIILGGKSMAKTMILPWFGLVWFLFQILLTLNNTFSYISSDISSYPRTAKPAWDVTRQTGLLSRLWWGSYIRSNFVDQKFLLFFNFLGFFSYFLIFYFTVLHVHVMFFFDID